MNLAVFRGIHAAENHKRLPVGIHEKIRIRPIPNVRTIKTAAVDPNVVLRIISDFASQFKGLVRYPQAAKRDRHARHPNVSLRHS